jgi:hypothetical protein
MIHFSRSVSIAPGKLGGAMAWANKITQFIKSKHGITVQVMTPVGGNPMRVGWAATYESLAAFESATTKMVADPGYIALLGETGDLFVPNSGHDELWRTV